MDTHDRKHTDSARADIAAVEAVKPVIDSFGVIIFFVVVVEILLLVGINFYQDSRVKTLTNKLSAHKTTLNLPENRTLNTQINEVVDGNELLKTALASKIHWSKFYTLLNGITPKSTRLTGLAIAQGGTFRAEGTTSSLHDLAQLITAWSQGTDTVTTPFSTVTLNSNGFSSNGDSRVVTFSVSGTINMGTLQ